MAGIFSNPIRGKTVILSLIITNIIYGIMLLWTIPMVMSFAEGMKIPDMMPWGYSTSYMQGFIEALGTEGRSAYLFRQLPLDMVYPILSGISYSLLIAWLIMKMTWLDSRWSFLTLFPLVAALFDYLENIGIIMMLLNYDSLQTWMVAVSSIFTVIKSILTTLFFVSILVLLAIAGVRKIAGRT